PSPPARPARCWARSAGARARPYSTSPRSCRPGPDVEELLQIGGRRRVVGLRERLAADRMIAAVGALDGMAAPKLVGERKAEGVMSQPAQVVDETIGDAVSADGEESDLATGAVDGSGHTATFVPAAVARRRDVDQR